MCRAESWRQVPAVRRNRGRHVEPLCKHHKPRATRRRNRLSERRRAWHVYGYRVLFHPTCDRRCFSCVGSVCLSPASAVSCSMLTDDRCSGMCARAFAFFLSTSCAILAAMLLLMSAAIWTAMVHMSKGVNGFVIQSQSSAPLGILVYSGPGIGILWAAFICMFASIVPYLIRLDILLKSLDPLPHAFSAAAHTGLSTSANFIDRCCSSLTSIILLLARLDK
jgi:hypothetical protein